MGGDLDLAAEGRLSGTPLRDARVLADGGHDPGDFRAEELGQLRWLRALNSVLLPALDVWSSPRRDTF